MPRGNPNRTRPLVHPEWLPGSSLTVRLDQTDADRVKINELSVRVDVQYDEDDRRAARKRGMPYRPHTDTTILFSRPVASLAVMATRWEGDHFTEDGANTAPIPFDDDPRARAQTLAELTMPETLDDIYNEMEPIWGGRSKDDQERFRGRAVGDPGRPAPGVAAGTAAPAPAVGPPPA